MNFFVTRGGKRVLLHGYDKRMYGAYELTRDNVTVRLLCDSSTNVPTYVSLTNSGELVFKYESYQLDVPFDSMKFLPAVGVDFTDLHE
ncbi:MAG: hypothetical protein WAU88_03850 [Candidatus Zixiibacteriota bacterium]